MKILHLIDSLSVGGAQTMLRGIVEYPENTNELHVFGLRTRENLLKIDAKNVSISKTKGKYSISSLWTLFKLARKQQFDIIHCHLFKANVFGFLCSLLVLPTAKLVIHEHGQILFDQKLYPLVLKLIKFKVDKFVAVSETVKKQLVLKSNINETNIVVLRNFSSLKSNIKTSTKSQLFTIGFAGRLSPEKGCEYLLRAAALLNFEFKLLIAGSGKLLPQLQALTKELKLETKVDFLGFVEDISKFYNRIDVCVIPSESEASPMVVPEIWSFGKPIIASKIPALEELICDKKNGLLFEPKNTQALAKKISFAYANVIEMQNISKHCKQSAAQYSSKKYMEKLNKLYNSLA